MGFFDTKRKYYTMPYAKAGECPPSAKIYNRDTGEEIQDVIECNAREGWLVRCLRDSDGNLIIRDGEVYQEKVKGMFDIRIYPE